MFYSQCLLIKISFINSSQKFIICTLNKSYLLYHYNHHHSYFDKNSFIKASRLFFVRSPDQFVFINLLNTLILLCISLLFNVYNTYFNLLISLLISFYTLNLYFTLTLVLLTHSIYLLIL